MAQTLALVKGIGQRKDQMVSQKAHKEWVGPNSGFYDNPAMRTQEGI